MCINYGNIYLVFVLITPLDTAYSDSQYIINLLGPIIH